MPATLATPSPDSNNPLNNNSSPLQKHSFRSSRHPSRSETPAILRLVEPKYTLAADRELVETLSANIKKACQQAETAAEDRASNTKGAAGIGATIGGLVAGIAEFGTHLATGGGSLVMVGKITAGGASIGAAIGRWLLSAENPDELIAAAKALAKERDPIVDRIRIGDDLLQSVKQLGTLARTAATADALPEALIKKFFEAFSSEYFDVQTTIKQALPALQRVPGMSTRLSNIPESFFAMGINQLVLDAQVDQPLEKRLLALQRLATLEKELKGTLTVSSSIYLSALSDQQPAIKAQALQSLFWEPALRPVDFRSRVEGCLKNPDTTVKQTVLAGLLRYPFPSGTIDIELERLADPLQNHHRSLQQQAREILQDRIAQGICRPINPLKISQSLAGLFAGATNDFRRNLQSLAAIYKVGLSDPNNTQPNLRLYLQGEHSEFFAQRLANELFHTPESFVAIDLGELSSADALRLKLYSTGVLSGKLLFLKNLDALDRLADGSRQGVIEALKPLFNQNDPAQEFDLRDSILAFSTAVPLEDLQSLQTITGRPLRDRIRAYSEPVELPALLSKAAQRSPAVPAFTSST